MNEIEKCPICGGVPLDKWEVTSVRVFQTGQACCGVDCNTNELWNQYAAAMELAKAEAELDASVRFLFENEAIDDDTPEFSEWTATHRAVMKQHMTAKDRVLEVFGK